MTCLSFDLVVWDFDGVLNRNIRDGRLVWQDRLRTDLGLDPESFNRFVFQPDTLREVLCGRRDLMDVVADWLAAERATVGPAEFLSYWFTRDISPDPEVGALLDLCQNRKVIGTNNEARRAAYIEGTMGFGGRVERIFASGRMGMAKPDDGFFAAIEDWAGTAAGRILLIDDSDANIAAAHRRGWSGFHFTDETRRRLPGILGID